MTARRPFTLHEGPQQVYRLYAGPRCLYVGITEDLDRRLAQHQSDKPWWPQVDRIEHETFRGRAAAMDAETFLIRALNPEHNVNGWGHRRG